MMTVPKQNQNPNNNRSLGFRAPAPPRAAARQLNDVKPHNTTIGLASNPVWEPGLSSYSVHSELEGSETHTRGIVSID